MPAKKIHASCRVVAQNSEECRYGIVLHSPSQSEANELDFDLVAKKQEVSVTVHRGAYHTQPFIESPFARHFQTTFSLPVGDDLIASLQQQALEGLSQQIQRGVSSWLGEDYQVHEPEVHPHRNDN